MHTPGSIQSSKTNISKILQNQRATFKYACSGAGLSAERKSIFRNLLRQSMKNGVELVLRNLKVYTFVGAQLRGWLRKFLCDVTLVSLSSMFNALVTEAFDRRTRFPFLHSR